MASDIPVDILGICYGKCPYRYPDGRVCGKNCGLDLQGNLCLGCDREHSRALDNGPVLDPSYSFNHPMTVDDVDDDDDVVLPTIDPVEHNLTINDIPADMIDLLTCPINNAVVTNPVYADDGRMYELPNLAKWLQKKKTSPFSKEKMRFVFAALPLRSKLEELEGRRLASTSTHVVQQANANSIVTNTTMTCHQFDPK